MKRYRIVIADDHSLIRQGLKGILGKDPSLHVVDEASNGQELLRVLRKRGTDLVILDISMPQLNGIDAVRSIRQTRPKVRCLILTMHTCRQFLFQAMAAGAHGYLMKDDTDVDLLKAIKTIREGKTYITPQMAMEVANEVLTSSRNQDTSPTVQLTDRERQVLHLVVQGCSSRDIAGALSLSPRTIDHHRSRILKKFNMKNKVDLVNHVVRNGMLPSL